MRIYAGYCFAQRGRSGLFPVTVRAKSREEAIGKLFADCQREYPIADGWRNHYVDATEVPSHWYTISEATE
jgi:hypothetical protein